MKAILSLLVILLLFSLFSYSVYAQDVFNPSDAVYTYNASSPQGSATNPGTPAANTMAKWVRTAGRINWDATKFKCYYFNGMAFRLRFPNNYNPANATKYPVIVFYHGGGESAPVTDNEDHLYWGAQLFEQRINAGEWNGFLVFPQQTTVGWDDSYFSRVNNVLDTLQKYNKLDPDKTISMGLSSGGYGAVAYAQLYPQRVASCVSSSPAFISSLNYNLGNFVHVPMWIANGGVDQGPDPYETSSFMDGFRNAGGNFYQTYLADEGHITWNFQWNLKNPANQNILTNWWNGAHKAQPLVFYGNDNFCNGTVNARLGITAGYAAYEWQHESGGVFSTIGGAVSNELQVTQVGRYRVRFKRDATAIWSEWTPNPVNITEKACSADTLFAERFNGTGIYYQADQAYKPYSFGCQNGVITSSTYNITQDGSGKTGNYFLLHNTSSNCSYTANDEVWHAASVMSVTPNTTYEYVFYLANRSTTNNAKIVPKINGGLLPGGFVQATGSGNASWKKFRFLWNSGDATYADIALVNQTTSTSGNDFAIDDISFGLPAPVVNQPPVARAGNDIVITSPASTATLNGTGSTDADGTISAYAWSKISGPTQYSIANAGAATTGISNLVQGVYSFQLTVTDNGGASSADTINVTVNPNTQPVCGPVPAGISSADVYVSILGLGAIANGSTCFTNPGTYTVKGAGDLSSSSDKFRFVYRTLSGNGSMTVKITSQDEVNALNKAGLMFRESMNNGSPYAFMGLTSGDGAYLQSQAPGLLGLFTTVSTTRYGAGTVKAPYYVKLTRSGSTFTGAVSADGISWTTVGSKTVSMNSSVYVGLAVCSRSNTTLSQAVFNDWSIFGSNGQQVMRTSATTTATATAESASASVTAPVVTSELKVYPNPATTTVTVDFSVDKKQDVNVSIISGSDGRVWYTENLPNFLGRYHKDFGSLRLPKGTYAVTVRTTEGVKTSILVKQ
jgi:pimeloyl-ACP methyl ester carboxylesterase/regulation of enolase protein 1 (concanavalin A-like superfamily)